MRSSKVIHVVSCHAEGEVGDVIVRGIAPPPGETIWQQRCSLAQDDRLRRFVLNEPRGGVFRHVKPMFWLKCVILLASLPGVAAGAAEKKDMPKEDVVDVPAIGQGLCVANVFQSNMVLQRDKPLNIWGWAEPGEEVIVSFAGQQAQTRAVADRSCQVTLTPVPANRTPQTMTVKGKSTTLTLENILVGDVWILGGQSNMEFPITKVDYGELEVISANFPQMRLLSEKAKGIDREVLKRISLFDIAELDLPSPNASLTESR